MQIRPLVLLGLLLVAAAPGSAQQNTGTTRRIIYGSSLPSTCSPNTGDVYFKTAATIGPYYCSASNTWSFMSGTGAGHTGSGTSGQVAYWTGTSALTGTAGFTFASGLLTATNVTASGLTANSFLYSGTGGALTTTTAPTNGMLLIGSTGAAPVRAALTAGSTKLGITNGAGSISLDVVPANITITDLGGTLTAAKGGTGQTSFTTGDVLYASSSTALSKLGIGTAGQVLTVSGSLPVWAAASSATAHRLLSATHTDTTAATPIRGDIIAARTASALWSVLPIGSSGTVLRSDGTDPGWSSVVLTTDVSGILPSANGGTANAFFTVSGPATSTKTFTYPNASATVLTDNAAVTAAQGGTGIASYTTGDLLYASAATTLAKRAIGTAGDVLTVSGGLPTWVAPATAAAHAMLSATHTDSVVNAVSRGSLIYGNATPAWSELTIGAANRVPLSDGTDVAWGQVPLATGVSGTLPVGNGGTGATTFTTDGVLYGAGASAIATTAQGAARSILTANAGAPAFSQTPIVQTSFQIGVVSTATGSLKLGHASSANLTTIQAGNASAAVTYTLPTADGSSGQVLSTNGSGTLTWATAASGSSVTLALRPFTMYPVTAGKVWSGLHVGAGSAQKYYEGIQVLASLDADATVALAFEMPHVIPSGSQYLRLRMMSTSSSQNAKINPKWACVSTGADPSSASLTAEGTQTLAVGASQSDKIQTVDIALDGTTACSADQWLVMSLVFETASWTIASVSTWMISMVWY